MKKIAIIAMITLLVFSISLIHGLGTRYIAQQQDWASWPMFHHDAQRTGRATGAGIFMDGSCTWEYTTGDQIVSSPAVSKNGIIYFGSWDMHLYALDHDGNPAPGNWPFSTSPAKISSSPAIAEEGPEEGTIYVGTHDNVATRDNFFAINPDGTKKWGLCLSDHVPGDWIGTSSAVIAYETGGMPVIYIASTAGYLYRIEDQGTTGVIPAPWPVQLSSPLCPLLQSPAISPDGQTIYIGTGFPWPTCPEIGELVAIDRLGNIRWSETLATAPGECVSSPSVEIVDAIPTIYAGTSDHRMCAVQDLGGSNRQIKWIYTDNLQLGGVASCPAIYDLNWDGKVEIIFGSGNKYVYAVSDFGVDDPRLYWKFGTGDEVASSPAIALAPQPTVFIGSKDNKIYSINWDETTWSDWGVAYYTTGGDVVSSPAVAQQPTDLLGAPGWVFVGSDDGKLYAFGPQGTKYEMVVAKEYEPQTVDPAWAQDTASVELISNVYETLIRFDRTDIHDRFDRFVPCLATQWTISDDGLTYNFTIRENVPWHEPAYGFVTAEDVEYSFERVMVHDKGPAWLLYEPLLGTYSADTTDPIGQCQAIDDAVTVDGNTVSFHLKRPDTPYAPYTPFIRILAQPLWSQIVCKQWCIDQGDWPGTWDNWVDYHDLDVSPLEDPEPVMMGTGPYIFYYWDKGVEYSDKIRRLLGRLALFRKQRLG